MKAEVIHLPVGQGAASYFLPEEYRGVSEPDLPCELVTFLRLTPADNSLDPVVFVTSYQAELQVYRHLPAYYRKVAEIKVDDHLAEAALNFLETQAAYKKAAEELKLLIDQSQLASYLTFSQPRQ